MDELALATLRAMVAVTTEPADGNTIADFEFFDAVADFGDRTGDFMTQGQRPGQAREFSGDKVGVGAADAAGADVDAHFATRRRRCLDLGKLQ
jgi:hypothetical protein